MAIVIIPNLLKVFNENITFLVKKLTTDFADYYGLAQIFLTTKRYKMYKSKQKMTKKCLNGRIMTMGTEKSL